MKKIVFIGSASGWGALIRETEKGPHSFQNSKEFSSLPFSWTWKETITPLKTAEEISLPPGYSTLPYIKEVCFKVAHSIEEVLKHEDFPVVIGGDHAVAAGTWAGIARYLKAKEKLGLIWIDAHMDAHTMETTPSKAHHGMPLAALLGYGDSCLVNVLEKGPILSP